MHKAMRDRVDGLVNTSVQDMQSGLWNYGVVDLDMLRAALRRVTKRREKTKAKILRSKISKLEKEQPIAEAPVCSLEHDMKGNNILDAER
jgi:hypothetical protein